MPSATTPPWTSGRCFPWSATANSSEPNETIGAQLVSVPMAIPLGIARRTYVTFLIILIAIFAIIFAILNVFIALSGDYTDKAGVGDSRRGQLGGRRRRGLR